ncbi:flavin-binding monooxygenase-like protein-like protein [Clohesyomyces aquaticus]|uniref:Flavin-binding monooxygenase-like protein-like protein n=1 Tax=Clohesyomyces aquaticus TaxID=1231657 RepID=A0A1Y1ZPA0_9PLEO|nr:flavin-binding monooxygenase-like protein-like protein [Clohesyomyces aquaticus]
MEDVDMVVVGGGLYGITVAATYHRIHPTAKILLLESAPSIGGPWAPHRIFPGLKTNNLWGTYEHPDFPMREDKFGVRKGEHVPAGKVTEYLHALIDDNDISKFIRLKTRVEVVQRVETGWRIHCTTHTVGPYYNFSTISTAKLILATGLANRPSMPQWASSTDFKSLVVHSADFPGHYADIVKPKRHTLIVGGGKSSWDIAYACATMPSSTATMLIRPSGKGPVWMSPPHVTPLRLWLEKLVFTRFFGFMSPCPFANESGFEGLVRRLLHQTWIGRKIVGAFWGILGDDVVQLNKLNEHPETKKLKPWRGAFEVGNALSILNYPTNFFELVKNGRVKMVVDEVERLGEGKEVVLRSGEILEPDAIVCATGWEVGGSVKFLPSGIEKELGLPTRSPPDPEDLALARRVERRLYRQYPFLRERDSSRLHHPDPALRDTPTTDPNQRPYRLYRFLVPPTDIHRRSIGFAGALMSLGNASCAYLQSLWLTAYLDGTLSLPNMPLEQLKYETYRDTQYCVIRNAMGYGNKFPDLVFDSLPYFDLLLQDLGFEAKRKGKLLGMTNWGAECFKSYGPEDYRGLVAEWQRRRLEGNNDERKNTSGRLRAGTYP